MTFPALSVVNFVCKQNKRGKGSIAILFHEIRMRPSCAPHSGPARHLLKQKLTLPSCSASEARSLGQSGAPALPAVLRCPEGSLSSLDASEMHVSLVGNKTLN